MSNPTVSFEDEIRFNDFLKRLTNILAFPTAISDIIVDFVIRPYIDPYVFEWMDKSGKAINASNDFYGTDPKLPIVNIFDQLADRHDSSNVAGNHSIIYR